MIDASIRTFRSCLVMASLAIASCSSRDGPEAVAKAFICDVAAGRQAEALERYDPRLREVGGMVLGMSLAEGTARARRKGGVKDVRIVSTDLTDDTHATVTAEVHYGDGSTNRESGKVRQIQGRWYVTA